MNIIAQGAAESDWLFIKAVFGCGVSVGMILVLIIYWVLG
jgi:hypothetical protein